MSDALRMKDHLQDCADCTEGNFCSTGLDYGGQVTMDYLYRTTVDNGCIPRTTHSQERPSMPRPTPIFKQIVATGAGEGYNHYLYGLDVDGVVHRWEFIETGPRKPGYGTEGHFVWNALRNPDEDVDASTLRSAVGG